MEAQASEIFNTLLWRNFRASTKVFAVLLVLSVIYDLVWTEIDLELGKFLLVTQLSVEIEFKLLHFVTDILGSLEIIAVRWFFTYFIPS